MESTNLKNGFRQVNSQSGNQEILTIPAESLSKFVRVVRPEYELFAPSDARASLSLQANSLKYHGTQALRQPYKVIEFITEPMSNLDQSIDVASSTTTAVISDLTNGEAYYFAVVASMMKAKPHNSDPIFCYSKSINHSSSTVQ